LTYKSFAAGLLSATSLLALASAVHAQDAAPAAVEEVVVTGSRIVRDGYQAPTPVTVATTEQLQRSAPGSIPDGLNQLPQFNGSVGTQNTGNQATRPNSGNYLNLRGLGAVRNLVLLDGQRIPPTSFDGTVDTNVIPQALIQRVDVVTGGASAAYGSDAVSGVVNFILDTRFNGVKGNASAGVSKYGDDRSYRFGLAAGSNVGERGHVLFSYDHYDRDGIPRNEDRPRGDLKITRVGQGTAANPYRDVGDVRYSNGTWGTLLTLANNATITGVGTGRQFRFLDGGALDLFDPGTPSGTSNYAIGGEGDISFGHTLTGSQDTDQFFGRFDYDVSDTVKAFAQLTFAESANEFTTIASGTQLGDFRIFADNAFLPAAMAQAIQSSGAAFNGARFATGGRIQADQPPKEVKSLNDVYTFLAGVSGELGAYNWRATYGHGDTLLRSRHYGNFDQQRWFAGLDAVRNSRGEIVCNITITNPGVLDSCVPINPFGNGSITPAVYSTLSGVSQYQVRQLMDTVAAEISGEVFELPAGSVAFAAGVEGRRQELVQTSNSDPSKPISVVGLRTNVNTYLNKYNSTNVGNAKGSYDVREVFAEIDAPLIKDAPLAYALSVNAAARYTDYSTSGGVTTWKVGLSWQPVEDLRVRYTRSRDIRAPTLYELFAGDQAARGGFNDIHTGLNENTVTLSNGNPTLTPEIGDTYTVGVVWQPTFISGFSASVDYYNIEITDAITNLSTQDANQLCENSNGTAPECAFIIRPTGVPWSDRSRANFPVAVRSVPYNQALSYLHGIDYDVTYRLPLDRFFADSSATVDMRLIGNYAPSRKARSNETAAPQQNANVGANPENRVNVQANYNDGPLSLGAQVRYIGAMKRANPNPRNPNSDIYVNNDVRSTTYLDLNANYRFTVDGHDLDWFVTVNNALNEQAPLIGNGQPSQQYPTNQALYDVVGRYYTTGIRFKF
jgi:outer membrane receptor protein involved in Fe transport